MNGEKKRIYSIIFACKLGISPSTYNIWENNPEIIKPKDAFKIAKTLDISINEIIF